MNRYPHRAHVGHGELDSPKGKPYTIAIEQDTPTGSTSTTVHMSEEVSRGLMLKLADQHGYNVEPPVPEAEADHDAALVSAERSMTVAAEWLEVKRAAWTDAAMAKSGLAIGQIVTGAFRDDVTRWLVESGYVSNHEAAPVLALKLIKLEADGEPGRVISYALADNCQVVADR